MISRRAILAGAGLSAGLPAARPRAAERPRLGIASFDPANNRAVKEELARRGWIHGRTIDILEAEAGPTVPSLDALLARGVDILVAPGAVRIQRAMRQPGLRIVAIDLESDPVREGFVGSLSRPGGLITGVWLDIPEMAAKLVQLLQELAPRAQHIAIVWDGRVGKVQFDATAAAATQAGLALTSLAVGDTQDMAAKMRVELPAEAQAVIVLGSPIIFFRRVSLVTGVNERRLPSISSLPDLARAGGTVAYGPNLLSMFRRSADYVDRILRGQSPGNLPVERPSRFELVVNKLSAEAIGLSLSPLLLARADEVIE